MSYGSRNSSSSPRRSSGRGRGKVHSKRGKRKGQKHHFGEKYSLKTSETHTSKEVVEKTYNSAEKLVTEIKDTRQLLRMILERFYTVHSELKQKDAEIMAMKWARPRAVNR